MAFTIIVLALLASALLILFLPTKLEIHYAFAGKPCGQETTEVVSISRHMTRHKCQGKNVRFFNYVPFLIKGPSLEREGLPDHTLIYVDTNLDMSSLIRYIDRFIILKIDTLRSQKEHPEKEFSIKEGFKARKMVGIFLSRMNRQEFTEQMSAILRKDREVTEASYEDVMKRMWEKYSFASQYYKDDKNIIVSLTYKDGLVKDYSFHSPKFLYGVGRYKKTLAEAA